MKVEKVKDEKMLQMVVESADFLCESGSHLYGTATPTSDVDLRGFTLPPFPYVVHTKIFKSEEFGEDSKVYSLKRFLEFVLRGDPLCTELFFANPDNIKKCSDVGQTVMEMQDDIISNIIYDRIIGYSATEWRKAMAVRLVSKERKKEKHDVINDIHNLWHPKKEQMDEIIKHLDELDIKHEVSSQAGLGVKRKADIEKYGFCRKSAAHSIRLVKQLTELMETGKISFPVAYSDLLLDIRNGKCGKKEVEGIHKAVVFQAEAMRNKSVLPDEPNLKKVWETYLKLVANSFIHEERFLELLEYSLLLDRKHEIEGKYGVEKKL